MKEIPNYHGYYADTKGNIFSRRPLNGRGDLSKDKRQLKQKYNRNGYLNIGLSDSKYKQIFKMVHRLVLETFVGPCPEGMQCCHNNNIRDDNRLENLRWDTPRNNEKDKLQHGTYGRFGMQNVNNKLTELQVRIIKQLLKNKLLLQREIADIFNIKEITISNINTKRSWSWL